MERPFTAGLTLVMFWILAAGIPVEAQEKPAPAPVDAAPTDAAPGTPLKQEELDQMLAPLALYPDSLLTQVLMASTYPIEIVQADRWAKANAGLKGDALATELEKQTWDASVKSLLNFPDVLAGLSDKLDWTTKIGDAFIADQKRVMDTIQKLRGKAQEQGNLESNQQQTVTVQQQSTPQQTIIIESSQPDVVYVPAYDPAVVYGTWWYPAYPPPPPYYYPPGYAASNVISFGLGVACGAAWGYAWGHCDWHNDDIDIDINQNNNFNKNIDRSKYQKQINNLGGQGGKWKHDASHRQGVAYRDKATAQRFGGTSSQQAAQAREQFRGRDDMRKSELGADGDGRFGGDQNQRNDRGDRAADQGQRTDRGEDAGNRQRQEADRGGDRAARPRESSDTRNNAFEGADRGGGVARGQSQRGESSRSGGGGGGGGRRSGGGRRR